VTALVPSRHPDDSDLEALGSRLAELETTLRERSAELTRSRSELAAFEARYRHDVGRQHEELDELERAIAAAELDEISAQLGEATGEGKASPAGGPNDEPPVRYTTDAVRRLFRDVAKAIHPDLAHDEHARNRRHSLMVEANRAYALGDEERLRWILQAWEASPEAVQGSGPEATRLRLERRFAQLEDELSAYAQDLASLRDTPLWKLKAMVDAAAVRGKDLVRDMVTRLKRDIMVARNRLDAIQSRP
jgi:hypothetical protein